MTISERRFVETKVQYTEDDLVKLIRQDRGLAEGDSATISFTAHRHGIDMVEIVYTKEVTE